MLNFRKHMNNEHPCLVEKLEEMEKKISSGGGVKVNTVTLHKNDFSAMTVTDAPEHTKTMRVASFGYTDSGEKIENAYNHIFRLVENTYNVRNELIAQTPYLLTNYNTVVEGNSPHYTASVSVDSNAINVLIDATMWEHQPDNFELVVCFI